ncbi:MAG: class I SAM-dependent methyltransferase [Deltaproteobacteria bacterium]
MNTPNAPTWPSHAPLRVLSVDDALLVVDKPVGVSTQSSERASDDMVARVRLARAEPYLGVLQRLERDVSGVLAFTRDRRFNGAMAPQFERHTATRTYLVAVEAWRYKDPQGVMISRLVPDGDGGFTVVTKPTRGEHRATLTWRVEARDGTRSILAITPGEGSLATARAQLAGAGHPVIGDARHGGSPHATPLIHLATLVLEHPSLGKPAKYDAPMPDRFARWLAGDPFPPDVAAWRTRLLEAAERRAGLAHGEGLDAYRLGNDVGDDLAGVTVDRYGDHALVQLYTPEATEARDAVLDAVASLGPRGVYVKFRPKQSNTLVDTRREDLAPARAVRGDDAPETLTVTEGGLRYRVRLGDGLSTGIFLDQRANRALVRTLARDAHVLNLFAYTCAFTVAAAAGGARAITSVDVASRALAWGRENLAANGFADDPSHTFVTADVFGWLGGARARGDQFDLVLLDPPSYSTTKDGSRFSAESDYGDLAARALPLVAPGGRLLAWSNHRGISRLKLRRQLQEAARVAGCNVASIRELPDPEDFPPGPERECHLKSFVVELE